MFVVENGDVHLCFLSEPIGNLYEMPLASIWNCQRALAKRSKHDFRQISGIGLLGAVVLLAGRQEGSDGECRWDGSVATKDKPIRRPCRRGRGACAGSLRDTVRNCGSAARVGGT
jgi:hypothetical protein